MQNKYIIPGLIAAIVVIGGVLVFTQYNMGSDYGGLRDTVNTEDPMDTHMGDVIEDDVVNEDMMGGDVMGGDMMETTDIKVNLTAKNFSFSTKEIRVKRGDVVELTLTSESGFHDWTVDEFQAGTKKLNGGESDTIKFVADKSGTFEYYCSVGTHRQMGMVGKLIVEP